MDCAVRWRSMCCWRTWHRSPTCRAPITSVLSHGEAGVDLFFVLSGLLIVQSLEHYQYRARPFLIARVARTYPVFLPVFVLAIAVQPLVMDFAAMPWIGPHSAARMIWSDGWPTYVGGGDRRAPDDDARHGPERRAAGPLGELPRRRLEPVHGMAVLCAGGGDRRAVRARRSRAVAPGDAAAGTGVAAIAWRAEVPSDWHFSRRLPAQQGDVLSRSAWPVRRCWRTGLGLQPGMGWQMGWAGRLGWARRQGWAGRLGWAGRQAHVVVRRRAAVCRRAGRGHAAVRVEQCAEVVRAIGVGRLSGGAIGAGTSRRVARSAPGCRGAQQSVAVLVRCDLIQSCISCTSRSRSWSVVLLADMVGGRPMLFALVWLPATTLLPIWAASWLHRQIEVPALRRGKVLADAAWAAAPVRV